MTETTYRPAHRQILRATAIVGGASAVTILIGLARNKVAALLLGPTGIGTISLLLNLVTATASVAGLGIAMSGVRALASAVDDGARLHVRRIMGRLTTLLALGSALAVWLLRGPLARYALGDADLTWQVGWLAPAVAMTVWSAMQIALLNGLRRLGDLARAQIIGAALGSALGIAALFALGERGIVAYVVAAPLGMAAAGLLYTARLQRPAVTLRLPVGGTNRETGDLIRMGVPMMLGGLTMPLGLLIIRAVLGNQLGTAALGQFTAAWTLSATYVGFVLAAMGTDYFPRLSAVIGDHALARQLVNDQAEVALMLALPVMLGVQAAAPWLIYLLYTDAFEPAVPVLQWQIAGDVLKLASWPLSFILLAQGRGKLFWGIEAMFMMIMTGTVWLLVRPLGLIATGIAYSLAYTLYFFVMLVAARYMIGLRLRGRTVIVAMSGLAGVVVVGVLTTASPVISLVTGLLLVIISANYAVRITLGSTPYKLLKGMLID